MLYGIGAIRVAIIESTGVDRNSMREKYRKYGDIGDVAQECRIK